ncbi:MAG: ABC transporter permease [Thermoleophilia bacterium]
MTAGPGAGGTLAPVARIARAGLREYRILLALLVFGIIVATQNDSFLTQTNLLNLGQQWAPIGIMAVGMTFVLIAGGFDLSVGAVYAFSAVLAARMLQDMPAAAAFPAAIAFGAAVGLGNGLLITKLRVNPFIATLGTALMVRGLLLVCFGADPYKIDSGFFRAIGRDKIGAVPVPFVILLAFLVVGAVVLWRSVYGRWIYATGGNDDASRLSGVRTDAVRISTYVLAGGTAAFAGCVFLGRLGTAQANYGVGIEFDVIAVALIGGISIMGGEGAMWRTAAGLAFLAVLQNFFNQASVNDNWQSFVKGAIIVGAVAFDSVTRGGRAPRLPRWLRTEPQPLREPAAAGHNESTEHDVRA